MAAPGFDTSDFTPDSAPSPPATGGFNASDFTPDQGPQQTVGGALQAAGASAGLGLQQIGEIPNVISQTGGALLNLFNDKMNEQYGQRVLMPGEKATPDGRAAMTAGGLYHWVDGKGNDIFSKAPPPAGIDARPKTSLQPITQVTAPTIPNFFDWLNDTGKSNQFLPTAPTENTRLNRDIAQAGAGATQMMLGGEGAILSRLATGVAGGLAAQETGEQGGGPLAQTVAGLAAGAVTGGATGMMGRRPAAPAVEAAPGAPSPPPEPPLSGDQLKAQPNPIPPEPAGGAVPPVGQNPAESIAAPGPANAAPQGTTPSALEQPHPPKPPPGATPPIPPAAAAAPSSEAAPVRFTPPGAEGAQSGAVGPDQQAARAGTLQKLNDLAPGGLSEVRQSAVTGDTMAATGDYQQTQIHDDAGQRMEGVIAGETNALRGAAENMVDRTGTQVEGGGDDQNAARARGTVIDHAIQGIQQHFDQGATQLYEQAKAAAPGQPIQNFSRVQQLLGDETNFAGTVEGEALYRGAIARAQKLGLIGGDGLWKPATVEQAERFRQWVGDQYTPRTAKMIYGLKDALDADVAAHGGPGLFEQARQMRSQQGKLLEEPEGIQALLAPTDRLGINRQVPIEQIPDYIANLPTDQFNHVINVLKSSAHLGGGELADGAAAAINEIKGHMAGRLMGAGSKTANAWDAKSFYKQLNNYSQKMPSVFTPREMQDWKTINDAGNVLRMDKKPGVGGAVLHNTGVGTKLLNAGVKGAKGLAKVGATVLGAHTAGIPGAIAGHAVESGIEKLGEMVTEGRAAAARKAMVEGRIVKLADLNRPAFGETVAPQPHGPAQRGGPAFVRKAQPPYTRKSPTMLNVGMDVNGGMRLANKDIVNRIQATGAKVLRASVHQSNTEPTLVATLNRDLTPSEMHILAGQLRQEAIPQLKSDGTGALHGPAAAKWGDFNPDYFLDHDGKPLSATPMGARLFGGKQQGAVGDLGRQRYALDYFGRDKGTRPEDTLDFAASTNPAVTGFVGEGRMSDAAAGLASTPQDRFMQDYERLLPTDKNNPAAKRINGNTSVEMQRDPYNPDTVHLASITADKPGIGQGGAAMRALTNMADRHGVNMTLDPIPFEHPNGTKIPLEHLERMYMDHGFKPVDFNREENETLGGGWQRKAGMEPLGAKIAGGRQRGAVGNLSKQTPAQKVMAENPDVGEHLTDQEMKQAQYRQDIARNVVAAFHGSPVAEEYAAAALAGAAKRGWYKSSAQAIEHVFGPDANRFAALLAAMSPQTSVEMNFHNALRTFVNWDAAGRPTDGAAIRKIMEQSSLGADRLEKGGAGAKTNVLGAWVNNSVAALSDKDPENLTLSGPKVHSFYQNLRGNVHEVTNDSWMAKFAAVAADKLAGGKSSLGPGKSATYMGLSAKVRQAAAYLSKVTGEKWTPAEVQETVWSWAKTAWEHANEYGGLATIPELVKSGELNDELIKSTPDFYQLFNRPEHASFLEGSRYGEAARGIPATKGGNAKSASASKKSAAASKVLNDHLLHAAARLEAQRVAE